MTVRELLVNLVSRWVGGESNEEDAGENKIIDETAQNQKNDSGIISFDRSKEVAAESPEGEFVTAKLTSRATPVKQVLGKVQLTNSCAILNEDTGNNEGNIIAPKLLERKRKKGKAGIGEYAPDKGGEVSNPSSHD